MKINPSPKVPILLVFPHAHNDGLRCVPHLKIMRDLLRFQHMGYNFIFSCFQENILEDEWIIEWEFFPWTCFSL